MHVRYDVKDETGESRRQKYERFEQPAPTIHIPDGGRHLWEWFHEMNRRVGRLRDGRCFPLPPSEFVAWSTLTGQVVYSTEYAILFAMDDAYCEAMAVELEAMRQRELERAKNPK